LRSFEKNSDALGMMFRDKVTNLQSILDADYHEIYQQAILGLPVAGPIVRAQ
jgi:hypothetical protein